MSLLFLKAELSGDVGKLAYVRPGFLKEVALSESSIRSKQASKQASKLAS